MKILIDTGIFVNILNDENGSEFSEKLLEKVQNNEIEGVISVITITEILSLYYKINQRKCMQAKSYIENIIDEKNIIPVLKLIAELAGKIKAIYKVSLGDGFIAATAILTKCDYLVSLDPEMKSIDAIKVRKPKEFF